MDFTDVSLVALRVFREVAERGTFTAAASALGYTQSAVSRQIAALERAAGSQLLERRREGVALTTAGQVVLRNAAAIPDQLDATAHDAVDVADLRGRQWIAAPASSSELLMGVWPGLDERPVIAHTVRDWLAKLQLVAAGAGLTTISASMASAVPPGVRVVTVRGG